jgi:uncharacterized protein YbjT (DUF2867 family)
MYAITGITGKVGGALARRLLAQGAAVRAILRDETKAADWAARGCTVSVATLEDPEALAAAFAGTEGVFILPPSEFDPSPGYPEARQVIASVIQALRTAQPKKILCLSTIGADAIHNNLLTQRTLMEQALAGIDIPVTFLRAGWFMENALWDVVPARDEGVLRSFLQPADKTFPMVSIEDIGQLGADLIRQDWTDTRIVELEGPVRVSPNDLAQAFSAALGGPVRVETLARERWEDLFRSQGMKNPLPRMRMLDGFNEGWIEFSEHGKNAIKGTTPLADVITSLVTSQHNN